MAGISFGLTRSLEAFGFNLYCYNESYEQFFADAFRDVQDFVPTREFFESCRLRRLRTLRNYRLAEPSQLAGVYSLEVLCSDYPRLTQLINEFEAITYEQFLEMKKRWLRQMHLTWLVQGHLTQDEALNMVDIAEKALAYVPIPKSEVNFMRLVKLGDRSVYNFEEANVNEDNPNSCTESMWMYRFDKNVDDWAVSRVLCSFMEEPTFNTLRTQEQLGYIVRANLITKFRMLVFTILVQSSSKDADYLEHRINEFIASRKAEWDPTEEEVQVIKDAVINKLKQKRTSLGAEATFNWGEVSHEEYDFDSDLKKIAAIERVTKERLIACFNELFFNDCSRLNIKLFSHKHRDDTETRATSQELNKIYYARKDLFGEGQEIVQMRHTDIENIRLFQKMHSLHPRL